jgi:hypothetical protein
MRAPFFLILLAAVITGGVVVVAGQAVLQPDLPPIVRAEFTLDTITPNADGSDDITEYHYELSENANVTITFTNEGGETFAFRDDAPRPKGAFSGLFSGVVDGYVREGETVSGTVTRRLMPNGTYTWELIAETETGETDSRTGTLVIADADSELPDLTTFTVSPDVFSPNQDGIRDRTQINVGLAKAADLEVYLLTEEGAQIFIPPQVEETRDGEPGRYTYDYDGGVDGGADPPPDGTYTVVATAQDAVGQRVERRQTLTLVNGGKPLAEIAPQPFGADVMFTVEPYEPAYHAEMGDPGALISMPDDPQDANQSDITIPVGDVLVFRLTVENYSDVPIRTHGVLPGTVYDQTQRAASLGDYDESGAWRVGIDCDTAVSDYPWRWRVGDMDVLETVYDEATDNTYYYLPPGERAVVWGGIRMTELIPSRNPQNCWAGLIHEDVGISIRNSRVGARSIELVNPTVPLYTDEDATG